MATPRMTRRLLGLICKRFQSLRLERLTDTRDRKGRRHVSIVPAVRLMLVGMMAGCKGLAEVEDLNVDMSLATRKLLRLPQRIADTTCRDTLLRLVFDELRQVLHRTVEMMDKAKALVPHELPFGVATMDGRSTPTKLWEQGDTIAQLHHPKDGSVYGLVRTITSCLVSSRARTCLDMFPIPASTNENGVFADAFASLMRVAGHLFEVVTYDSGANSAANARLVLMFGKNYVFRVKSEQPTIYNECKRKLGRRTLASGIEVGSDIISSKVVTRTLWLASELAGWHDYPGLRCAIRLHVRTVDKVSGKQTSENRYYITSLAPEVLTPVQWALLVRRHWAVENNCHNTWDRLMREDKRPWVRLSSGMLRAMVLRRIAYNLLGWFRSVTQRSETARATPWLRLMKLLQGALETATTDILRHPRPLELLACL